MKIFKRFTQFVSFNCYWIKNIDIGEKNFRIKMTTNKYCFTVKHKIIK